ncbi:MAG TPA: hypothetical protein VF604_04480 [Pyrinomonadaceae bacterium]|jgi:hypothetical protein
MSKKYETEDEILSLVESFENGTIARGEWNHAGHLTVALYYCAHHDLAAATEKMRRNLLHHLKAVGVDLTKEMPYHETLTAFWMRTIDDFRKSKNGVSLLETANALLAGFDKDYPLRFYSRELLFSDAARRSFVAGDLEKSKTIKSA